MERLLHVSSSPHLRDRISTSKIMLDVIIALLPATLFGLYRFKLNALIIILLSIITCVLSEYLFNKCLNKDIPIKDLSAIVTGLMLALNLPATVPFYFPVVGGIFAIVVVKGVYGGIGQNIMNPALTARCFLLISFTGKMTTFTFDALSSPTPLAILKSGEYYDLLSMFLGNINGSIGETSTLALLIGAIYLLYRRIITMTIPATIIISFSLMTLFFSPRQFDFYYLLCQICGGGFIFGTFFMATDYATSPITEKGKIIYGIILGILTGLFRFLGPNAEGISYAIIIANLLVPIIERYTLPNAFGKAGKNDG